ncbi:MAG: argininosuccinate lyase [Actinomycetota bacterium]|nr:argininosuccinate lyase [Actinomycetota bacterium]
MTLWAHRMGSGPAPELMAFNESLSFDRALGPEDCEASAGHVRGLGRAGILTPQEVTTLSQALASVREELERDTFVFTGSDEDIHTAIERRVTELTGEIGAKLHTGRSRNDQVATALRLWSKHRVRELATALVALQDVLARRAEEAGELSLPGYTHLQRAQPVPLAHQLLAHAWALARDVDRLVDAHRRLDVSPLGAGALAGSTLGLDPVATAEDLGFSACFENSLDAVSDRDFVAEVLFCAAMVGVHLSRLGEEVVLYSSEEFGYYRLDDAFATGSSMLPQKKNPDIAELARAKAGRLIGHLTGLLATLKGLPLAYNKDLQEDKEPLFDAMAQLAVALPAITGMMATVRFDAEAMTRAADSEVLAAVDLAEWQVARGVPFRAAHGVVGALVRRSLESTTPLAELVRAEPSLGEEAAKLLAPGAAAAHHRTRGGAGHEAVRAQLDRFRTHLAAERARLGTLDAEQP